MYLLLFLAPPPKLEAIKDSRYTRASVEWNGGLDDLN